MLDLDDVPSVSGWQCRPLSDRSVPSHSAGLTSRWTGVPMSQRLHPPAMVLSSRANRLLSIATLASVAERAGMRALDLDLAGRAVTLAGLRSSPRIGPRAEGRIDTVWLPLRRAPRFSGARVGRHLDDWIALAHEVGARQIVVDREAALRPIGDSDKRPLLIRLQEALGTSTRVVVVLRPGELEGTRAHLVSLGALRRTAEEWDFDLGIDLVGTIDPRWEAEAALQRLHNRISLVRLTSIVADPTAIRQCRLTSRSLAYLLDQSFSGTLSLVPRVPWTGWFGRTALDRAACAEVEAIGNRYQRIFSPAFSTTRLPTRQEH